MKTYYTPQLLVNSPDAFTISSVLGAFEFADVSYLSAATDSIKPDRLLRQGKAFYVDVSSSPDLKVVPELDVSLEISKKPGDGESKLFAIYAFSQSGKNAESGVVSIYESVELSENKPINQVMANEVIVYQWNDEGGKWRLLLHAEVGKPGAIPGVLPGESRAQLNSRSSKGSERECKIASHDIVANVASRSVFNGNGEIEDQKESTASECQGYQFSPKYDRLDQNTSVLPGQCLEYGNLALQRMIVTQLLCMLRDPSSTDSKDTIYAFTRTEDREDGVRTVFTSSSRQFPLFAWSGIGQYALATVRTQSEPSVFQQDVFTLPTTPAEYESVADAIITFLTQSPVVFFLPETVKDGVLFNFFDENERKAWKSKYIEYLTKYGPTLFPFAGLTSFSTLQYSLYAAWLTTLVFYTLPKEKPDIVLGSLPETDGQIPMRLRESDFSETQDIAAILSLYFYTSLLTSNSVTKDSYLTPMYNATNWLIDAFHPSRGMNAVLASNWASSSLTEFVPAIKTVNGLAESTCTSLQETRKELGDTQERVTNNETSIVEAFTTIANVEQQVEAADKAILETNSNVALLAVQTKANEDATRDNATKIESVENRVDVNEKLIVRNSAKIRKNHKNVNCLKHVVCKQKQLQKSQIRRGTAMTGFVCAVSAMAALVYGL